MILLQKAQKATLLLSSPRRNDQARGQDCQYARVVAMGCCPSQEQSVGKDNHGLLFPQQRCLLTKQCLCVAVSAQSLNLWFLGNSP